MLQAKDLKLGYKGTPAIHGISFGVKAGEVVAVVGANGAGKSTILRGISGIIQPLGGDIVFCGERLNNRPPHEIVGLGIAHVPEGRLTFARMTVEQNLLLGAYTVKSEQQSSVRLEEMYELFPRLKERRTQLAGTMSGGEQQMLVIARGLMSDPKLLMLDEPSLGIAPKLVMQIFDFIRKIKESRQDHPAGGAERPRSPGTRRPGLCPADRPNRHRGQRRRTAGQRPGAPGLSWPVITNR